MRLFGYIFAVATSLVLPIGAMIWIARKKPGYARPVIVGILTFAVFQLFTRIPIMQYVLPKMPWYLNMAQNHIFLYALFLGCTAALFEEVGRYITMKLLLKRYTFTDGLAFGIGHGGFEAVMLVGLSVILTAIIQPDAITPAQCFAGGVERLSAMVCHVAFSLMVMRAVRESRPVWLLWGFLAHALLDILAVVFSVYITSTWVVEGLIGVYALLMLAYCVWDYKHPSPIPEPLPEAPLPDDAEAETSPEDNI